MPSRSRFTKDSRAQPATKERDSSLSVPLAYLGIRATDASGRYALTLFLKVHGTYVASPVYVTNDETRFGEGKAAVTILSLDFVQ